MILLANGLTRKIIKTFLLAAIISSASVGCFILFTSQGKGDNKVIRNFCPGDVWCSITTTCTFEWHYITFIHCPVRLNLKVKTTKFWVLSKRAYGIVLFVDGRIFKMAAALFCLWCKQHEVKGWRQGKDNVNLSCMSIFASNFFRRNRRPDFEGKENRSSLLLEESHLSTR